MPGAVKRSYVSPHRTAQARITRRAVLDSADRLFVANGYGATTLQQIADGAGVSVQTIYSSFGNKRALLGELLDVRIAGDDEPVAVNDRDWMHVVFHDPDPRKRLHAYATAVAGIFERAGDVFAVLRSAADTDTDLVQLAETTEQRRRSGAASVVDGIIGLGALTPSLTRDQAIDTLWTLNSPDVHRRLVRECAWPRDRYAGWLGSIFEAALLSAS